MKTFALATALLSASLPPIGAAPVVVQDSVTVRGASSAPRLSQGIAEIVKMADNGIEPSVIRDYVAHSSTIYQPTVDEIIYLHQKGFSSELITAIIQRGAELRRNLPAPAPNVAQMPGPVQEPPPAYSAPLTPPDYAAAPTYVEPYPDYSYPYYYSGYYPYSYPWYGSIYIGPSFYRSYGHYYPRVGVGFGGFHG